LYGAAIVMLTSPSDPQEAVRCRELGVVWTAKPVMRTQLVEAARAALGESCLTPLALAVATTREIRAEPASASTPSLRVLLAEDNLVNQRVAQVLLERRGHTVKVAATGREALAALERAEFDLVLMDAQMPEMDGFEASRAIREREKLSGGHIPIIALTANAMSGDRERCLAAGMDGYSSKPIRAEDLFREIERLRPGVPAPVAALES
jgi:two-component system sensor histidine kinase/response regulator